MSIVEKIISTEHDLAIAHRTTLSTVHKYVGDFVANIHSILDSNWEVKRDQKRPNN